MQKNSIRLKFEIWLLRYGLAWPLACGFALVACWLWMSQLHPQHVEGEQLQTQLDGLHRTGDVKALAAKTSGPSSLEALRSALATEDATPTQIQALVALAHAHGISLPRGEYGQTQSHGELVEHIEIAWTFTSTYLQTRSFVEAALQKQSNLTIDDISLVRDSVNDNNIRVAMRMTVWQWKAIAGVGAAK